MFRRRGIEDGAPMIAGRDAGGDGRIRFTSVARSPGAPGQAVTFHPDVPHRVAELNRPEPPSPADDEGKRLIVGRDISLTGGDIVDCERLTVEGAVDASMRGGRLLEVAKGGCFRGVAIVDNADIAGLFDGELTVNNRLTLQASGRIVGTVRYGQLEIERGGRIDGTVTYDEAGREADLQAVDLGPRPGLDGLLDRP